MNPARERIELAIADLIEQGRTEREITRALVTTCGRFVKWDIGKAIELCADILEDVNAHEEAAALRLKAQEVR